jgi:Flp pilus assembly protein TadG
VKRRVSSAWPGGERGTTVVEMALVLPLMFLLVMGTLDFGRAVYGYNALANAARDGARFASLDPTNTPCIRSTAVRHGAPANLTTGGVTVTVPGTVDLGQPVTVSVQSSYQPLTAVVADAIGVSSITLTAHATMQIRNLPANPVTC